MKRFHSRRTVIAGIASLVGLGMQGPEIIGLAGRSASAAENNTIRVFSFPGSLNLLVWLGQEKGFFNDAGINVELEFTKTSMELATKLAEGRYDIATSSIDNVIAYNNGQGQVELSSAPDFFGFMNISKNMTLPLIVQKDITTFEDLRGKTLAVDAVSTGFSFVLKKILETHGLNDGAYELISVGNARARLKSLKAGEYAGAILTPPFDRMAKAAGLWQIGSSEDFTENYQGTCFISTRQWAEKKPQQLRSFIKAIGNISVWLKNPDNHSEAARTLVAHNRSMNEEGALQVVANLSASLQQHFNMQGIDTVLSLRREYGASKGDIGRPEDYINTMILDDVLGTSSL